MTLKQRFERRNKPCGYGGGGEGPGRGTARAKALGPKMNMAFQERRSRRLTWADSGDRRKMLGGGGWVLRPRNQSKNSGFFFKCKIKTFLGYEQDEI